MNKALREKAFRDADGNWWLPIAIVTPLANERDNLRKENHRLVDERFAFYQQLSQRTTERDALIKALDGLLPKGRSWRDGTMDHLSGIKEARLTLANVKLAKKHELKRPQKEAV